MSLRNTDWLQEVVFGSETTPLSLCRLTIEGDDIALAHHTMGSVSWTLAEGDGLVLSFEAGIGWSATRMMPGAHFIAEFLQPFMFLPRPSMTFEIICLAEQVDGSDLEYSDAITGKVNFFLEGVIEQTQPDQLLLCREGTKGWVVLTEEDIATAKIGEYDSFGHLLTLEEFLTRLDSENGEALFHLMRRLEPAPEPTEQVELLSEEELAAVEPVALPEAQENKLLPSDLSRLCPRAARYKDDRKRKK